MKPSVLAPMVIAPGEEVNLEAPASGLLAGEGVLVPDDEIGGSRLIQPAGGGVSSCLDVGIKEIEGWTARLIVSLATSSISFV